LPMKALPLTPPVSKHYVSNQHKKVGSSWVKSDETEGGNSANTSPFVSRTMSTGTTPIAEPVQPKKLIPVVDPNVPLAARHNNLIQQCK